MTREFNERHGVIYIACFFYATGTTYPRVTQSSHEINIFIYYEVQKLLISKDYSERKIMDVRRFIIRMWFKRDASSKKTYSINQIISKL